MASGKLNHDVVCSILSFVAHFQDSASLFSCALVSRIFCAPALDHLWRTQDSLGTLVMYTLPTDSWQVRDDYWIHLTRDLTPADIQRLLMYSSRIRSISNLRFTTPSRRDWHPHWSTLLAISSCAPGRFLPNILHLHAPLINRIESSNSFIPFIETLITPRLAELSIELPEVDDPDTVLRRILSICPQLQRLAITSPCPAQLSSSISHLPNLCSFITDNHTVIELDALLYLSTLSQLEDATICLAHDVQLDQHSEVSPRRRFPSLKHISLKCSSLATANDVLDAISSPSVEGMQTTCASTLPEQLQLFFTTLSKKSDWRTSLQALDVSVVAEQDGLATHVISPTWLTSLFSFPKLRALTLDCVGVFDLDDTEAVAFAEAWKSIESLRLVSSPAQDRPSRVSWIGTFAFCNNCPNIRELHLSYDTVIASAPPKMPQAVVRARK